MLILKDMRHVLTREGTCQYSATLPTIWIGKDPPVDAAVPKARFKHVKALRQIA